MDHQLARPAELLSDQAGLKVSKDRRDRKGRKGSLVSKARLGRKVHRVCQGRWVRRGHKVWSDHREHPGQLGHKARLVWQDLRVWRDPLDLLERLHRRGLDSYSREPRSA